jgi:hypothetical protein
MASTSTRPSSVRGLYSEPRRAAPFAPLLLDLSILGHSSTVSRVPSDFFVAPPAEEWVFLPPTVSPPSASAPVPTPSHLPTPFQTDDDTLGEVSSTLYGPLQLFTAEFFTTALGMPFEVGKTLLQIEYRPRKRFVPIEETEEKAAEGDRDWGAEDDEVSERARVEVNE